MATYSWPLTVENVRQAGINWDLNNVALPMHHTEIDQNGESYKILIQPYFSATMPLIKSSGSSRNGSGSNSKNVPPLKKSRSANRVRRRSIFLSIGCINHFLKMRQMEQQQQQHSNTFSGCRSLWPRLSLGTRVGQGTAAVDSIWPGDGATLFHLLPRPKPQQKVASC